MAIATLLGTGERKIFEFLEDFDFPTPHIRLGQYFDIGKEKVALGEGTRTIINVAHDNFKLDSPRRGDFEEAELKGLTGAPRQILGR